LGKNKFEALAKEYINSLVICQWDGWWHRIDESAPPPPLNHIGFRLQLVKYFYDWYFKKFSDSLFEPDGWFPHYNWHKKEYYTNIHIEERKNDFLEKTRFFIDTIIHTALAKNEDDQTNEYKYLLLDQALPPISFLQYIKYFTPPSPKIVIVDKDPRDLYVMNKALWGSGYVPTQNVALFIKWYLITRESRTLQDHSDQALFLPFESMVYDYEASLNKIMNYIDMTNKEHIHKLKYFNPELSVKNTQIFKQYPELKEDVKKIEVELEEYCYNFPECSQTIQTKHFLIEELNFKCDSFMQTGKIPKDARNKTFAILWGFAKTSLKIPLRLNALKTKKGLKFIRSLVKIIILLLVLPIRYLINIFLYFALNPEQ
jgi:hypothetical protein